MRGGATASSIGTVVFSGVLRTDCLFDRCPDPSAPISWTKSLQKGAVSVLSCPAELGLNRGI
jgi:hypothetical protein